MVAWPTARLGDHLVFMTSGSRGWGGYVRERGTMFLRIQNVGRNHLLLNDVAYVDPPSGAEADRTRVLPGDVLLSITADLGRTAVIPPNFGPAHINQHLAILRLRDFEPRFVSAFISLGPGQHQIARLDRVGVKSGLNFDDVRSLRIPFPPLSEQCRIADILDKAGAIRRKRKEAIALTEELLRSAFLEMFGDPVTNPKGWKVKALGELLADIESGWSPTCVPRRADEAEWGVLKLGAVTTGRYVETENKALGDDHVPLPYLEVKAGDVLFARKNTYEHVAACVLVERTRRRLMIPDLVFRLVPNPDAGLTPPVLWAMMSHPAKRKQIQALAGGTAGSMPNISKERLRTVLLPVPDQQVQSRFSKLAVRCTAIRSQQQAAGDTAEELFASLVQHAFRGHLTGTDVASNTQVKLFAHKGVA